MWSRLYPHGVTAASGVWDGRPLWDPRFRFFFFEKNCKSDLSLKVPKLELISVCVSLNFPPCERQSWLLPESHWKKTKGQKKKNPPAVSLPRWSSLHMLHLLQDPGWICTATGPGRHSLPVWLSSSCCYQWATIKQQVRPSCVCFHVLCSR